MNKATGMFPWMVDLNTENSAFVEELYESWICDPGSVSQDWQQYFKSIQKVPQLAKSLSIETPKESPSSASLDVNPNIVEQLRQLGLFSDLTQNDLELIAHTTQDLRINAGDRLFSIGDPSTALYIITEGSVLVERDNQVIAQLGVGEVVGEMSIIESRARSAGAIARTPLRALCIYRDDFNALLERRGAIARGLLKVLAQRIRTTTANQERVDQLIRAYRERGHVLAQINPLSSETTPHAELTIEHYGLNTDDLDKFFSSRTLGTHKVGTLRQIMETLKNAYCGPIGVQYMHIDDLDVQEWIRARMEDPSTWRNLTRDEQIRVLRRLTDAEVFEQFLHRKFLGAKRFSLEGGESLIPLMDLAIEEAAIHDVEEIVIGMAHRGRMNVLANILKKSPALIFREFADADPDLYEGRGDVKYHLGHSSDWTAANGKNVRLSLCFNPSHLEFVGPVAAGRVRAKQDRNNDKDRSKTLAFIIHGDSAIAGEGVVQELLNMSELPGYAIGGTVHVVLNNQIGFTTTPDEARSTRYATDIARMLEIPVFHVNGENPEAVARVIQLAMLFRSHFGRDVVIDMYCYRKHGHNEGDEASFTQPLMYKEIKQRKSVRQSFVDNLLTLGQIERSEADTIAQEAKSRLETELSEAREPDFEYSHRSSGGGLWTEYHGGADDLCDRVSTGVPHDKLTALLNATVHLPEGFEAHRKIAKFLENRKTMAAGDMSLDWGAAEALAFASLLSAGTNIRLSGQDAQRGTFSHRHSVLRSVETGETYVPLNHLSDNQGHFEVLNSPLTETAVLGFDYGYSLDSPDALVLWEAQFGDFANVAQVIIDQFISSAEDKWSLLSGIVMLLPHGFEGQGPEHSSARLERYLTLAAEDNMQVVNLTTPAQLFHCLRRQILRPYRKPLIVMSPKSLLRHPAAVSSLDELASGSFHRIIPDNSVEEPGAIEQIILCSGKIYYELAQFREEHHQHRTAIVRLEQYYPLSDAELEAALSKFPPKAPVAWVQEEPQNMGAWPFLHLRYGQALGDRPLSEICRPPSASPATGSAASHKQEQAALIRRAFNLE